MLTPDERRRAAEGVRAAEVIRAVALDLIQRPSEASDGVLRREAERLLRSVATEARKFETTRGMRERVLKAVQERKPVEEFMRDSARNIREHSELLARRARGEFVGGFVRAVNAMLTQVGFDAVCGPDDIRALEPGAGGPARSAVRLLARAARISERRLAEEIRRAGSRRPRGRPRAERVTAVRRQP
ncbi:hypothetical protein ACOQFB_01070 [Anaeromyxobacter sp. Red801]|uniref:hypothetical protein n=1 Tax=Anaeromyxobacter sp. Red801 TaxID=3411632 RepID=UPI003B9E8AF9